MSLRRKILLGLLALVLLAPSAALYYVASTEAGLRFLAARLNGKVGPVIIDIGAVGGTLADGFRIESLRVQHRLSDVRIEGAAGKVALWPLLTRRQIRLSELTVHRTSIALLRDPNRRDSGRAPRFLPATLRVDAESLRVDDAELILLSGQRLHATAVTGGATVLPTQVRVRAAELDYEQMHLAADGRVLAADPVGLEGDLAIRWHPTGQPEWQARTHFDGDLDRLPLVLDIDAPLKAHVQGAATMLGKDWQLAGDAAVSDVDLEVFGGGNALGILSGQLAVTLDRDGFTAKGPVTAPGLRAGAVDVDFHGAYADKRLTITDTKLLHPGSGMRATVRGTVDIVEHGPRLALTGEWSQLRWPLAAREPAFVSARGSYALEGVKPWKARAEGLVEAAGLQAMPARLTGELGGEAFTIDDATLQLFGGSANFKGEARWKPAESWRIEGSATGIDPAQLRADLPGQLGFDFRAQGAPFGDAGTIDFTLSNLAGKLRGQPASGKGQFTRPGGSEDLQFRGVDLQVGRARLQLDGGMGTTRDLRFAVDADDLSLFDAEARGRISARGRYAGTAQAPLLLFKARGTDFEWQGYSIDALDADLDIDLGPGSHARGQVDLMGLHHGVRTVRKATLDLSGTGDAQRVTLDVDAAPLRTALVAEGRIQDGLWQGAIDSLTVGDGADLALRLEAPATLQFNVRQLELGQLCLVGEEARGCGNARRTAEGRWSTTFSAESMPLRALTAGLTQDVDYEGTINLRGALAGSPDMLPTGSVRAELDSAQLRHRLANGRDERLSFGSGRINAEATTETFSVQVALDAAASGSIQGKLDGQRLSGDWHDYPIKGSLDASTDGLSLLDIYVGGIDKATGHLTTRVDISGTLGRPEIAGMLQLKDASIDIYQVNLALRELQFEAHFDNTALDLSGQSKLGNGVAQFNGKLAWREGEPFGDLHVEGERLLVVNVPEARIEASPNLDFKLAGRRIDATGEVRIPKAMLEPADLTNAVLASSDEVLVGAPIDDPARRWTVVSDIRLVLGEDVNLESLGLKARLGGGIEVRTDESQVSRGQGELNIVEGKYAAFGRQLDIERGRLIFRNVPVGDPGVDLRAQKVFPDITAGINVRGSLRAPSVTFYSEPAIPQSQIVSLILAGGSLESLQASDRPGAARNDLLMQGGAVLAQRVGTRVGIDDVGIESSYSGDTSANDTSLVLGKYLTPRLYISYGISLAEAINTLKLRYTIGDRWTIKTEAGRARSADIVYTLKRK